MKFSNPCSVEHLFATFEINEAWVLVRKDSGRPCSSVDRHGYVYACINNKVARAHRIIYAMSTGAWPTQDIDHIDGCRTNNKFSNLRQATHSVNMQNKKNCLGIRQANGKFRAYLKVNGRQVSLGRFNTAEEAKAAYLDGKKKHHQGYES